MGYGFSNDATTLLGAPSFSAASFQQTGEIESERPTYRLGALALVGGIVGLVLVVLLILFLMGRV